MSALKPRIAAQICTAVRVVHIVAGDMQFKGALFPSLTQGDTLSTWFSSFVLSDPRSPYISFHYGNSNMIFFCDHGISVLVTSLKRLSEQGFCGKMQLAERTLRLVKASKCSARFHPGCYCHLFMCSLAVALFRPMPSVMAYFLVIAKGLQGSPQQRVIVLVIMSD